VTESEALVWRTALEMVPTKWIKEFTRLVEDGIANKAFMTFFDSSRECQAAFEMICRADRETARLVRRVYKRKRQYRLGKKFSDV
jgi:hypothetical protein